MENILDVYVNHIQPKNENQIVTDFVEYIIFKVFQQNKIPATASPKDMHNFTNEVMKLSGSRICYVLNYIIDVSYNLSEDTKENKLAENFLAQSCFSQFREIILFTVDDDEDAKPLAKNELERDRLAEKHGFFIYCDYNIYMMPENVSKRLKGSRIEKLKRINSL